MSHSKIRLPAHSTPPDEILAKLNALREHDARWKEGRTFSLVYHASDPHTEMLKQAHHLYFSENALNPGAFKSLKRLEVEVVSAAADILGGDEHSAGTMSSGGTESIFLAVKTYRDQARALKPHIKSPEMVLPITAHPAFMKAAHCLDVKPVLVNIGSDFRVRTDEAKQAISGNTILLVGSAPAYPHGVIDPIAELAQLAQEHGLGMHVDACLGGFLLPFLKKIGVDVAPFDFSVPGVTSISADLHKYGFAAKGASVILYKTRALRKHQFFVYGDWPGGLFGSPTMAGTRPGGSIAAAWATLFSLGEEGYKRIAQTVWDTSRRIQEGIAQIPTLSILGKPAMSVFAFTSDSANIFAVGDVMERKGWHIDRQPNPDALHLMITPAHAPIVDAYLADLKASVEEVLAHPEKANEGMAAMYGMVAKLPDRQLANEMLIQYMDDLYST